MRPILLAAVGAVAGAVLGAIAGIGLGGGAYRWISACADCGNDTLVFGITGLFLGAIVGVVIAIRLSRPDRPAPDDRIG